MSAPKSPVLALPDVCHGDGFHPLYSTTVMVRGGQSGHGRASGIARADDGSLVVDLRLPKQLHGPGGGTNPEQLFAAGYAASFHGVLGLLADRSKVAFADATIAATVAFGRDAADGGYALVADLRVRLPGVERAVAEALVRDAERLCPYAKMARQGIAGTVTLLE